MRRVLSGGYWGEEGLAWSPRGDLIYFSASTGGTTYAPYAVPLSGKARVALPTPSPVTVLDISREGRWLVAREDYQVSLMVRTPGAGSERDLSWLDFSNAPILSPDGRLLLFGEEGAAAGLNYAVCFRKTDGSPVVRLGEGNPA